MSKYRQRLMALIELLNEPADETPEEVDAYLREAGYDPDELVARMQARIRALLDKYKDEGGNV